MIEMPMIAKGTEELYLLPGMSNRHGLVAGATGLVAAPKNFAKAALASPINPWASANATPMGASRKRLPMFWRISCCGAGAGASLSDCRACGAGAATGAGSAGADTLGRPCVLAARDRTGCGDVEAARRGVNHHTVC